MAQTADARGMMPDGTPAPGELIPDVALEWRDEDGRSRGQHNRLDEELTPTIDIRRPWVEVWAENSVGGGESGEPVLTAPARYGLQRYTAATLQAFQDSTPFPPVSEQFLVDGRNNTIVYFETREAAEACARSQPGALDEPVAPVLEDRGQEPDQEGEPDGEDHREAPDQA